MLTAALLLILQAAPDEGFDRAVAPLLAERCIPCHSGAKPKGKLDLSRRAGAARVLADGLFETRVEQDEMPPERKLPAAEKAAFKAWLARGAPWGSDPVAIPERVGRDAKGRIVVRPVDVEEPLRNPWPRELEEGYVERAQQVYARFSGVKWGGNVLEQEKDLYPKAMLGFLAGNRAAALEALQRADVDARDHAHTLGVDLYWCFTLKGQIRKYHFFGQYFEPAYRDRMREAMRIWTEQDPLRREHPVHGKGKGGPSWGPDGKGSWVDVRGTDNLRAMREIAVYLFAEEAGHEEVRKLYLGRLRDYVVRLWHEGMSEWDSENYHGHSLTSWHNLYDFARDAEAKALGKAALDWLYAAGAIKYWRGGYGGPVCRDYGNANVVFGSNASHPLWLLFGDSPQPDPLNDRDDVHLLTSAYRPPAAVVALARKDFERPVEMTATKPGYNWTPPGPRYFETQYFGRTFQMGSLASETAEETWNVSPFKLMAWNSERGVDFFVANTVPLTGHAAKKAGDQITQSGPRLVWLRPSPANFQFLLPKSVALESADGVRRFRYEKTWLALHPFDESGWTEEPLPEKASPRYGAERLFRATMAGFALEVGEEGTWADFAARSLPPKRAGDGVEFGPLRVRLNPASDLPAGERRADLYAGGPVESVRGTGRLRVSAGGRVFEGRLDSGGRYVFENR